MNNIFSFAGMQRSGNHAIINWFLKHFCGYYYRNNILGPNYFNEPAQTLIESPYIVEVDSWENYNPKEIKTHYSSRPLIKIVRDPFNWFASWFRYKIPNPNVSDMDRGETIQLYLNYFEGHGNLINYNEWVSSYEYRRKIEERFGLGFSDEGLKSVSNAVGSGGSSFDGLSFDGRADEMRVTERWRIVCMEEDYRQPLLKYRKELTEISREFFNTMPPKEIYG